MGQESYYGEAQYATETNGTWGSVSGVPTTLGAGTFYGVSCTGIENCTAVGEDASGGVDGVAYPMYATESNGTWVASNLELASDEDYIFYGVSCTDATDCTAVGDSGIYQTESNGIWGPPLTAPGTLGQVADTFRGVSCTGPTDCTAVGDGGIYQTESNGIWGPVAEDPSVLEFFNVSCTGPTDCTAVGYAGPTFVQSEPIYTTTENPSDTISFNSDLGAAVASMSGPDGSSITLPSDTYAGYTFNGWFTAANGGTEIGGAGSSYAIPPGGATLYAQWSANATETITFDSEGGSAVPSMSGLEGTTITLPGAPTYAGYTFDGWFAAPSGGNALTSPYAMTGSITLYAQWTATTVTAASIAALAKSDVQNSANYNAAPPLGKAIVNGVLVAMARVLAAIGPSNSPAKNTPLIDVYRGVVTLLRAFGLVTSSQAATLTTDASEL